MIVVVVVGRHHDHCSLLLFLFSSLVVIVGRHCWFLSSFIVVHRRRLSLPFVVAVSQLWDPKGGFSNYNPPVRGQDRTQNGQRTFENPSVSLISMYFLPNKIVIRLKLSHFSRN